ncbi:MAG: branched-chain amino acid ABC transporter permease [Alphaproteobacteria bacterium]
MKISAFWIGCVVAIVAAFLTPYVVTNEFYLRTAYTVLQFVVLATAWNIFGGYGGYVNFGSAGFFGIGAYTAVAIYNMFPLFRVPDYMIFAMLPAGGVVAAVIGLGAGYLTLRLRGVYFSIATLAMAIVLQTLVTNWHYVGGAKGASILPPQTVPFFATWGEFLFVLMAVLAVLAIAVARYIERSWIGRGLAAIRDNEEAAECMGVPTLRLKLFACTLSGFIFGVAGAPLPYYVNYIEPVSAFNLIYAVNALAMPMIGGATTWIGPLFGAIVLGTAQEVARVTISSEMNLLIVGVLLVFFVIAAPEGFVGLVRKYLGNRKGR